MVTFLNSERLQHKQGKTLKALIAAHSETDLCAVSTPSLYTHSHDAMEASGVNIIMKITIQDENLL